MRQKQIKPLGSLLLGTVHKGHIKKKNQLHLLTLNDA